MRRAFERLPQAAAVPRTAFVGAVPRAARLFHKKRSPIHGKVLFVALGGGIGAALRYLLTELANLHGGVFFPYGTILANLIGSFCIGILFVFFSESSDLSPIVKLFFVTGILGGFTTFSTYNMELLTFVRTGAVFPALAYFSFNVIGGFVCCWLGFATGNALWG